MKPNTIISIHISYYVHILTIELVLSFNQYTHNEDDFSHLLTLCINIHLEHQYY